MKKLLIVSDTYHPKVDGIVRFLDEIIPRLKNKFKVTLLIPDLGKTHKINGVNIEKIPTSKWMVISGYKSVEISKKTKNIVEELVKDNDIVFVQDLALLGILSTNYSIKHNKKLINYFHQIPWEMYARIISKKIFYDKIKKIILNRSIKYLNKTDIIILSNDEFNNNEIRRIKARKEVIPLGVDIKIFKPGDSKVRNNLGIKDYEIVIGYVGRISEEKNIRTLVKAFDKLYKENKKCKLLIVGDGNKKIKNDIRKTNSIITGFVKKPEEYYKIIDIFVLPSETETSSLSLMEAMSSGNSVITTRVGNAKIYVKEGINGYFIPIKDVNETYEKIKKLAYDKKTRIRFGKKAREEMKNYTWDKTVKRLIDVLDF